MVRVAMVHVDLGIGGAEQLIVNIARSLQEDLHHSVTIFTSHHDRNHCFEETHPDSGIIGKSVKVYGDFLPRNIFGLGTALFAILRMIYLALIIIVFFRYNRVVSVHLLLCYHHRTLV